MKTVFVWIFGGVIFLLVCVFSNAEAQSLPVCNAISGAQGGNSQTNGTSNLPQKGQNRRQRMPAPERKLESQRKRKRKKVATNKRKKTGKNGCDGSHQKPSKTKQLSNDIIGKKRVRKKKEKRLSEENDTATRKNAQQIEKENKFKVKTERIADIPLLIGAMMKMRLQEIFDKHIPRHWKQRKLSWGWTAVIWLAYVLSERDHRKVSMQEFTEQTKNSLSEITGQQIGELDFTDDRLSILLKHLSKKSYWEKIENELSETTIKVWDLSSNVARVDATTVSGNHEVVEGGLFQRGVSKDNPELPQIKIMAGALDPLGMPLATDIVSGEKADDILYIPIIDRINSYFKDRQMLYVADSKMSAFEIRQHIKGLEKHYLCPIPMTGKTPENMEVWINKGILKDKEGELTEVYYRNEKGEDILKAKGYELDRHQSGQIKEKQIEWTERVLIVKSPAHANKQEQGLEKRLKNAIEKIYKLTPPRGPGKRQIEDENTLKKSIDKILKNYRVEGLLECKYNKEVEKKETYIGRGKGGENRPKRVVEKVRYQILTVTRNEEKIKKVKEKFGWKAFVTDVPKERLCFVDVIKCYRKEYRVERIFNRLKSRLKIAPQFVKKEDQILGMNRFLTLGVRVLTLIEYVVRRSLQKDNAKLEGLHPENRRKLTDNPTSDRLLKRFSEITLTFIEKKGECIRIVTSLSRQQKEILERIGLECSIYENLENKSHIRLSEW
jgi:transposase